jgi:ATP-dependent helicase Lhr and Lhr-like helicase
MSSPASKSENGAGSTSYALLSEGVRRWVYKSGWTALRDIQEEAIPLVLNGDRDLIVAAPTASGKTEAAFLPICSSLVEDPPEHGLGALYISPLKALINDQQRRLEPLCEAVGIPVGSWHGDISGSRKRRIRERPDGVLLITPESVEGIFVNHGTAAGRLFGSLRFIIIDELHAFIGSERGRQLQSLLHRIELAARHRVARIGLSATLGDMRVAAGFLRPGHGDGVGIVESSQDGRTLKVQLRGYLATPPRAETGDSAENPVLEDLVTGDQLEISDDVYERTRGHDNLVFANSRAQVEQYADLLRRRCEREKVPNEFWPHHGNLAKSLREDVEQMLREPSKSTTAVCTSTLELGIDVGTVSSVGQIGAPFSVAAMRQRLGRCGRRPGDASALRLYVSEQSLEPGTRLEDVLREEAVQAIAVVELLIDRWYEPPVDGALHLSTLVQQILSTIAQHGGAKAGDIWRALCASGPFECDQPTFLDLLRGLATREVIQQVGDGDLILAPKGERIVGHYSFYAAFATPEEYRLIADGVEIGSLPINFSPPEESHLIFGGRRWTVLGVDHERRVISVQPSEAGRVPVFHGGGGEIHDGIRARMRDIYMDENVPVYLDPCARQLLDEGRRAFREFGLDREPLIERAPDAMFFPWAGDRVMNTLTLGLTLSGCPAHREGVAVVAPKKSAAELAETLRTAFVDDEPDAAAIGTQVGTLELEKHHWLIDEVLLVRDFATSHLDVAGAIRSVVAALESNANA